MVFLAYFVDFDGGNCFAKNKRYDIGGAATQNH